ncbi:MAG: hypothetical protein ACK4ZU_05685 [Allorhizobium sp.]
MATEPNDNQKFGQAQEETDYASNTASGAKPAFALSAWSLIIGGLFLILVLGGLLMMI